MSLSNVARHLRPVRSGRRRVLVVEDDAAIGLVLKEMLTLEGFDVTHVVDGATATATLDSEHFDAVVLDVMLPGRDGIEVLKSFRERHGTSTPVIMLTALDDDRATWKGWTAGCDLYLTKPFEPEHVVAALRKLIAA